MKGERTKEDREHIDDEGVKNKELKELMPDETHAISRAEKKQAGSAARRPSKKPATSRSTVKPVAAKTASVRNSGTKKAGAKKAGVKNSRGR